MMKLADFGLRHVVNNTESNSKQFRIASTKGWMCPTDEVNDEGRFGPSFDIFPLGAVFAFTASKGMHPFGRDIRNSLFTHQKETPHDSRRRPIGPEPPLSCLP